MLSVVIGLLAFGVTIPGFEAYNTNWKKAELDSTRHETNAKNPERRPARDSFITQPGIAVNSTSRLKPNDTLFDKMYSPKQEAAFSSEKKIQNNKMGIRWKGFQGSKFFRPRYKSLKTTCDCNVYKVYSNDEKSVMFRNNYELWSNVNYFPEPRSVSLKIRRSEPEEEFSGDGRFIYDDDYSLINYVDKGKWGNDGTSNKRGQVKRTLKKKNSKRETEDREFSVMFHSRKDNEYRDKLSNNHDFVKTGKKKSVLHFEKKKYKHEFSPKPERKLTFLERRNNLRESYNHVARTPLNLKSSKRKYPFWTSKKEKVGAKLETLNAILTSPKSSLSSLIPPRSILHWATTRSYVAAISAHNKITPATLSPNAALVPPALLPFLNLNLTDSLITARKSDVARYSSTNEAKNQPAVLVNQSGSPQFIRLGDNNLDLRSLNLNPNLAFPFGFNVPIVKPVENNAGVYGPPAQVTTPVVFFFNAPTEGINPLSNYLDKFKNTTTWNAKQGPPGNLNAWSNLVNLVNFQMDSLASNQSNNIPTNLAPPFLKPMEKTRKSVDVGLTTPPIRKTQVEDIHFNPPLPLDSRGLDVTQGPIIGAEALVNFLQNALLPQNALLNELGLSESTKVILSSTADPGNLHELPIDNNLIRILAPTRTILTEGPLLRLFTTDEPMMNRFSEIVSHTAQRYEPQTEPAPMLRVLSPKRTIQSESPLLRLFTTEEPLMNRFSDIISRNADRKIPIVYDIDEAPQLLLKSNKLNVSSLGHILHDMPVSRIQRNIIDRHVNLKKNKTSIRHKLVEKQTNLTTPWLNHILTTTENMLYAEMKVQSLIEASKPKAKKLNLLFKSKAKPNPKPLTTEMVTKQVGKTVKPLTPDGPKKRARKACSDSFSSETKTALHD
ncbi:hypothetical protein GE061_017599 [Apolygus lucorum]|uniref:Uncharacterized protein n=1 Tax=Apolygus lucorum TaxID=248454 RepID=A0A8S9XE38_APOLU|nr:hypothetical protein GE061_017599 [Apolygus lucorum]